MGTDSISLVSEVLSLSLYRMKKGQSIFGKQIVEAVDVNDVYPSIDISFGEIASKAANSRDLACASYDEVSSTWVTSGMSLSLYKTASGATKATCLVSAMEHNLVAIVEISKEGKWAMIEMLAIAFIIIVWLIIAIWYYVTGDFTLKKRSEIR